MIIKKLVALSFTALLSQQSCITPDKGYSDVNQKVVIGHGWSDTDNQIVAEAIVEQMLKGGWYKEHKQKYKKEKPVVGIGRIKNLTSEELDTDALINFMKTDLINSRKVKFVANKDEARDLMEKELAYQHKGAVKKTSRKKIGAQTGLAYFLVGEVSSKTESDSDVKMVNYQVNFRLVELESSEEVWAGQKRLRKKFEL